jgi:plasmid stabilization system protein ParE
MNLFIRKSPLFHTDVTHQFSWYFKQAGEELAWQFFDTVDLTLKKVSHQPDLGRLRDFQNPSLKNLRSLPLESPFRRLLIFYRNTSEEIIAERLIHGARDLPRRLSEPSGR